MIRLALFEPDIAPNVGALMRLGACLGVPLEVIEPCGFVWDDKRLRRAGLDYRAAAEVTRHRSFDAFRESCPGRLILLTTKATRPYPNLRFEPGDILLLGRESAGVPEAIHARADHRVRIPMRPGLRSINVTLAAAMVLGEALRQTACFDPTMMETP